MSTDICLPASIILLQGFIYMNYWYNNSYEYWCLFPCVNYSAAGIYLNGLLV